MSLTKIKKIIKHLRKKKYQKIILTKKILILRNNALNSILKNNLNKNNDNKKCDCCKFYKENLNKKNFLIFYKKFSVHLKLKASYNLNSYRKKTNKNACIGTYLKLSNLIIKNKLLNDIQKLNIILKINDLLLILNFNKINKTIKDELKKNINYERNLIKKFI